MGGKLVFNNLKPNRLLLDIFHFRKDPTGFNLSQFTPRPPRILGVNWGELGKTCRV
jgi:hypothetical protein